MSNNIQSIEADVTTSLTVIESISKVGTKALATKRAIYLFTKRTFDIAVSLVRMSIFAAYCGCDKNMLRGNRGL